jgi:glutamate-ammonia-ligase adenylyltransferase
MVRWRQTQTIPDDADEERLLARRLGFADAPAFWTAYAHHTAVVDAAFRALFHGAEEERQREDQRELVSIIDDLEQEEAAAAALARLGFRDPAAGVRELRILRDGPPHAPSSPRRRAAIAALAPALLREIARSAAPDRALRHMASFIAVIGARSSYLHLLLENPGLMRLLVRLFATSELLSTFFLRHPELLDSLVRADLVRIARTLDDVRAELATRLAAARDVEAELDTLRRFRREEFLRIGVHDIEGELDAAGVSRQLSHLAEAAVEAAVALARPWALGRLGLPAVPATEGFAVIAMGKLGGSELGYHSDLDLIFVYDPGDAAWWRERVAPHELFTRVAQRTMSVLQTPTAEGIAYKIDTRLRPSGNQGALVTSVEAFETYHRTSAALWERQALVKARVVAGPPALRARVEAFEADPETLLGLARRLGYEGSDAEATAALRADHARHRADIAAVFDRVFAEASAE